MLMINTLQTAGDTARAVEIARQVYTETGSLIWQRVLANSLWSAGNPGDARPVFEELKRELGGEPGFLDDYASLLLELEDHPAALAVIKEAEELGSPSPNLLHQGARPRGDRKTQGSRTRAGGGG